MSPCDLIDAVDCLLVAMPFTPIRICHQRVDQVASTGVHRFTHNLWITRRRRLCLNP